ncbi:MAG: hypothetical protein JST00_09405 [Deltaproteobacteria bacterium]|nr:hypothetical protein [Deltaproteobacteria bacterium]
MLAASTSGALSGHTRPDESGSFPTLDEAMRLHITRALCLTGGRIEGRGGAADVLGLNPHTLRGKMRRLKIDWARYRHLATRP